MKTRNCVEIRFGNNPKFHVLERGIVPVPRLIGAKHVTDVVNPFPNLLHSFSPDNKRIQC